jgi:hypothetical protein
MAAYREIARGRQVLSLGETFANGGASLVSVGGDRFNLPRLAIARADQTEVRLRRMRNWLTFGWGPPSYSGISWWSRDKRTRADRWRIDVPFDWGSAKISDWSREFAAKVPMVPAPLRPAADLSGFHILWEAEWDRVAPRDPALLKRLSRGLYAVLSTWDLTPVERAVLAGRSV